MKQDAGAQQPDWSALMRSALAGDQRDYRRLLELMTPVLRGVIRARASGMDPEWCEDVVQETLLAVHLKRATWNRDLPLRPWVYAIARHKLVDAFRRRGRSVHLPVEDFAETLPAAPQPDGLEQRDAGVLIAMLPDRDAALLRCLAVEERGHDDCGTRLGLSPGALRVALHRALQRLARLRQEAGQ
ncbi:sigma-70 family RNA polymerase sigma factor [Paracoccus spongiarum]|uniref:Sigma-70 family RNA polymerase sigma factor n=1 Tax=Paracoccus spongiarum TaxID=3064387 RepID=A0ABT9JIJ3_9RHOB|nr:sigma-70 family RNA polymerase sigma factor [Paracoccus sp. 2205BS29-5]MDP5308866.1 sigma-70 family RNA polymerase sigma factor [Paracoccus sp. 2205BS29-5]